MTLTTKKFGTSRHSTPDTHNNNILGALRRKGFSLKVGNCEKRLETSFNHLVYSLDLTHLANVGLPCRIMWHFDPLRQVYNCLGLATSAKL